MQLTNFKEELSLGKGRGYSRSGATWFDREMVFDGDYLYVSFHNYGTYMVSTADPSISYQISTLDVTEMSRAADGNLYFFSNHFGTVNQLAAFKVAEHTQPLVAASVQKLINALPESAKAKVTKLAALEAAEEKIAQLKKTDPTFKGLRETTENNTEKKKNNVSPKGQPAGCPFVYIFHLIYISTKENNIYD